MSAKNNTQVIIAGKIYTLSGYESEEYLQRVASYLNGKISEFRNLDGVSQTFTGDAEYSAESEYGG